MSTREIVRRLRAHQAGAPLPSTASRPFPIPADPDILVVSFVRMGGESRPWGIAWGHPGAEPETAAIPEPRNRDAAADLAARFAPALLEHLRCPGYADDAPMEAGDIDRVRQVWLPNATHLDMLHHLAFAYAGTRIDRPDRELLRAFGRACGWLFREGQRPGQLHVVVATAALRDLWTFPAEDVRQGHLGFLLAWLTGGGEGAGDAEARRAAALLAEQTPVATSLDPTLERDVLAPLLDQYRDGTAAAGDSIVERICDESGARWRLTTDALAVIRADPRPENRGIAELTTHALREQWWQYARIEHGQPDDADGPAFTPGVETDRHPAAAGSRFHTYVASAELVEHLLVHDDEELQADAVAAGDAAIGEILRLWDEGEGRRSRPVWVIRDDADHQLRWRPGADVAVIGAGWRTGTVRRIEETDDGRVEVEVAILAGLRGKASEAAPHDLAAGDPDLIGCRVGVVSKGAPSLTRDKAMYIWKGDGPGAWLTHGAPSADPRSAVVDDIDDVAELAEVDR